MEVYLGFYLIIALFVFTATASIINNVIGTMMFWQMMRVRYILNEDIKNAWSRFDRTLHRNLLDRRLCPALVTTLYDKLAYRMFTMAQPPQPKPNSSWY